MITIRINEPDSTYVKNSIDLQSVEIYAGVGEMNGPVESMGISFRLPTTLIFDVIKRECQLMNTPTALNFLKEMEEKYPVVECQ